MLSFRKKIVLSHLFPLIACIAILFPFVQWNINSISLLVIIGLLDLLIIQYMTRPIQWIIDAIRPYEEGKEEFLPRIVRDEPPQVDEFSKLAYTLNSLTDRIREQIENLTLQKKETEDILESVREGIIATDTSAKVTFINQAACRMIGISHDAILKQMLNSIEAHSPDLAKKCHELVLHALQTSESISHTWTGKKPLYLDLISAPLARHNGALLALQDKTSDYRIVEMGKDFIANASHELRTPITIIRGFAETLQDLPKISPEMLHEITEKIVRTCGRLDKLVRSLLTLADVENLPEGRLKTADLVLIAENCKHFVLKAHQDAQIHIQSEVESAPIVADADLIELAVSNLLENAVKYSQGSAQIEMRIREINGEVELTVEDRGIGMSEKDLPHIFERFYTVNKARSRKSGGAGLGLSIVRTIIEKHRGSVAVRSELGLGSAFMVKLPVCKKGCAG